MDLIHTNPKGEDIGVLHNYTLDLAFGSDENDFELTMDVNDHRCEPNGFIYIEGTEYGGIIDRVGIVTKNDKLSYLGRTWHGILASKIISPMTVSGEANVVIGNLLNSLAFGDLFVVSGANSGLMIDEYSFKEYVNAYSGITKMLASVSGKLKFVFSRGKVTVSAIPSVDYSKDEQFDSDQVEMDIEKVYNSVNHLICVGKSDKEENLPTVHLYKDTDGLFKTVDAIPQPFSGLQEIVDIYEYTSQDALDELLDELADGNMDKLQKYSSGDSVGMNFSAEEDTYDVGDTVGAKEIITGIFATEKITKKIVTISQGSVNINYEVGE